MSELLELQQTFTLNIAKLIFWAYSKGYEITFGESYDDDGVGHIKNSNHYRRLAQDICLFKDNEYLTKTSEYRELGEYWKMLHSLNRWGGDFEGHKDGNHFSMFFQGMA